MRAVVQRVSRAEVRVDGRTIGGIAGGLCVLLGVAVDDTQADAQAVASKVTGLRIFRDNEGLMNRPLAESGGALLLISQFTLHGDVRKGRRPSFITAAREELARALYELTGKLLEREGLHVAYGEFGAMMDVELVNDGPVTILIDSKRTF
ncbi:MAG: D-tyrosyl-tRNA(Tyr) deacylase [Candidatus Eremiobacteraeota bacterium]|nr:D-tyrosyl-tRNA(Tyr) deacylase [Candidatus Eremiobacteraeota bacterium]